MFKLKLTNKAAVLSSGQSSQQSNGSQPSVSFAPSSQPGVPSSLNPAPPKPRRGRPPSKIREQMANDEIGSYPVEEHLILRMPPSDPLTAKFREIVSRRREYPADFEIQWKDSRRGIMVFEGQTLLVKIVDLPCIIESQKTFDRRQFYKVADICQMIVVERPSAQDPDPVGSFLSKANGPDDYIENSGITPPLKYCRVRRFRKRVNKRTVESIEREVARLLKEDQRATQSLTSFVDPSELDNKMAADADEELINVEDDETYEEEQDTTQQADSDDDDSSVADSDLGADLEDEIARAMDAQSEDEEEEEDEVQADFEGEVEVDQEEANPAAEDEEDDDDAWTTDLVNQQKMLREEMKDLNDKIQEKTNQKAKAVNAIIQKRFDEIIRKLESERELKLQLMDELDLEIEQNRQNAQDLAADVAEQKKQNDLNFQEAAAAATVADLAEQDPDLQQR